MPNNPQPSAGPQAAPSDAAARPMKMNLDRQTALTIRWADGRESRYPLAYLRTKCPCATCRTPAPAEPNSVTSLNILPANFQNRAIAADASLVGNYALQIQWADGHDTGIYDFRYLRDIDPANADASGQPPSPPARS